MKLIDNAHIINIQLHEENLFDLEMIDKWLDSILKIKIEPYQGSIMIGKDEVETRVIKTIWRVLLLAKTLFQATRTPIFDLGNIIEIFTDKNSHGQYTITVSITKIEFISVEIYKSVLSIALKIVLTYGVQPITSKTIQTLFHYIENNCIKPLIRLAESGKSTIPILEAAYKNNIPFMHLGRGIYQLGWGSKSRRIDRSTTELDSAMSAKMSHNKVHTASLLKMAGLPAGEHIVVKTYEDALSASQKLGWPVVVKPIDQDRGEGVNVGVTNSKQLHNAFQIAYEASRSKNVIIEREVSGVCCRIFIVNQQLLYAVKRLPKSIIGDGKRTIRELIKEANTIEQNTPPWLKKELFPMDTIAMDTLKEEGFTFESIPNSGQVVALRKIESTQWGGVDEDVTKNIHPDNLDIALRATALFGLNVAGVDMITSDISIPWYQNNAIINEINYSPLLGGGEISKSHIPVFLESLIEGDGRLPIIAIVGDNLAMELALKLQEEKINKGVRCYVSSHKESLTDIGKKIHFTFDSLYKRCKALLMDSNVEEIILVIQTDELLNTGFPIDLINELKIVSDYLVLWNNQNEKVSQDKYERIISLLQAKEISQKCNAKR